MHDSGEAAWNMAVDQAICEATADPNRQTTAATLRFYTWDRPTLSVGYFQKSDDLPEQFRRLANVRRATGGGAILHDYELTYSLTLATANGDHGADLRLYRSVHQAFARFLGKQGIAARPYQLTSQRNQFDTSHQDDFLCFRRRTDLDLVVSGYKVLGSAQRRSRGAILQHGSLLLQASPHAPQLPGIADLTSKCLEPGQVAQRVCSLLSEQMGVSFSEGQLTEDEQSLAERIVDQRFAAGRWWSRR